MTTKTMICSKASTRAQILFLELGVFQLSKLSTKERQKKFKAEEISSMVLFIIGTWLGKVLQ